MTTPIIVLLILLALKFGVSTWLEAINIRCVRAHSTEVPEAFKSFVDLGTYKKAASYTIDKNKVRHF